MYGKNIEQKRLWIQIIKNSKIDTTEQKRTNTQIRASLAAPIEVVKSSDWSLIQLHIGAVDHSSIRACLAAPIGVAAPILICVGVGLRAPLELFKALIGALFLKNIRREEEDGGLEVVEMEVGGGGRWLEMVEVIL